MSNYTLILAWAAAIVSLIGLGLNINKSPLCWPLWLISTLAWAILSARAHDWPMAAMQVGIEFANIYGFLKWREAAMAAAPTMKVEVNL